MASLLITGANRGIGLEFVRQYLENGDRVYATCRNPDGAKELQELKSSYPDELEIVKLDVEDQKTISEAAKKLAGAPIDILINNAGILPAFDVQLETINYEDWEKTMRVNLLGPMRVTAAFYPNVIKSKQKKVIFVSSAVGSIEENASGGAYQYRTSKTALNQAMKTLQIEKEGEGLLTLSVHPGWVQTDMGGENAMITPKQSVAGLRKVIEGLNSKNSGGFFNYKNEQVRW